MSFEKGIDYDIDWGGTYYRIVDQELSVALPHDRALLEKAARIQAALRFLREDMYKATSRKYRDFHGDLPDVVRHVHHQYQMRRAVEQQISRMYDEPVQDLAAYARSFGEPPKDALD